MAENISDKAQLKSKPQNGQTKKNPKATLKDKIMGCKTTFSALLEIFIQIFGIINHADANQQHQQLMAQMVQRLLSTRRVRISALAPYEISL